MEPKKANRLQLSAYLLYYSTYSANFPLASATATLEPAAGCAKHADLEAQTLLGGAPTNETFDLQISSFLTLIHLDKIVEASEAPRNHFSRSSSSLEHKPSTSLARRLN